MSPNKDSVRTMFDEISPRYDFLNHLLSFGIDHSWRRRVVKEIRRLFHEPASTIRILDVATGTGDLAMAVSTLQQASIEGIDISTKMMEIGRKKVRARGLSGKIVFREGEAENIPFEDNLFDVVMVAFGVRNFEELENGISEMKRVLKPGGVMLILEFSHPERYPMKALYSFYSSVIIPLFGKLISRHREAYTYLPDTVADFPSGEDFIAVLRKMELKEPFQIPLTGGIASLYCTEK
ncbi:MAG: bifunctional demethylmenaquinone methyltransferase/2-methoxy-6-polyprenyl-1,4-benzoquinol methylase UbiE [Bacteroidales bacterium]|nr:bifunctional demethylmenaquinone methyltransferase/2-methoxy-6-polyprenyl-1,4-benzoquinol methylase UbiE [Bacteroidota bacterium]MBL6949573.1 bifunctional demethylmenaquinone methyltransferase/2-methoxy-6-polyprenyl-1,4-benzoquinol methylase UbiE [Bacteroidales bacterium]